MYKKILILLLMVFLINTESFAGGCQSCMQTADCIQEQPLEKYNNNIQQKSREELLGALCDAVLSGDWDYENCEYKIQQNTRILGKNITNKILAEFNSIPEDKDMMFDSKILIKSVRVYMNNTKLKISNIYFSLVQNSKK